MLEGASLGITVLMQKKARDKSTNTCLSLVLMFILLSIFILVNDFSISYLVSFFRG
jgi:cytochrome c biogenesis factor